MVIIKKFLDYWQLEKAILIWAMLNISVNIYFIVQENIIMTGLLGLPCIEIAPEIIKFKNCDEFKTFQEEAKIWMTVWNIKYMLAFAVDFAMIYGIYSRSHKHMLAVMIANSLFHSMILVRLVIKFNIIAFIIMLALLAKDIYLMLCFYSLYVMFKEESHGRNQAENVENH